MNPKLLLICSFFSIYIVSAQDLIAVQNGNTPAFYADLSEAIKNAVANDTIYIPGKIYVVNDTINKPIHLVGVGINPNFTQATGITSLTSPRITSPQIILGDNADGGSITGIYFTTNYYNGNPYNNITQDINTDVSNFLIDRCYFGSNVSGKFSNSVIKQNIFRHRSNFNAESGNTLITNNIFCSATYTFTNCTLANSIFIYNDIIATNCIIENNILNPYQTFNTIKNCNIRNNVNTSNGVSGTNLKSRNFNDSADLTTVFVDYTGIAQAISFTADFQLPDASSYKNAGADGKDIGIYGGRFPWKDGSVPFNPHIKSKSVDGSTIASGNLPVNIEVEAQQN